MTDRDRDRELKKSQGKLLESAARKRRVVVSPAGNFDPVSRVRVSTLLCNGLQRLPLIRRSIFVSHSVRCSRSQRPCTHTQNTPKTLPSAAVSSVVRAPQPSPPFPQLPGDPKTPLKYGKARCRRGIGKANQDGLRVASAATRTLSRQPNHKSPKLFFTQPHTQLNAPK